MSNIQNKFFSCVESRIQDQGAMYARFHLGPFFRSQALTVANMLRRTLLSEIPSIVVTNVQIEGVVHEFATIPGVQESVLDVLLNLKTLVFTICEQNSIFKTQPSTKTKAFIKVRGPAEVTAGLIKLPPNLACVWPNHHIATLSSDADLAISLELGLNDPKNFQTSYSEKLEKSLHEKKLFHFETIPSPIQKVNYVIHEFDAKTGFEYVALEIWTDGSLTPKQALQFALKQITKLVYGFAELSNNLVDRPTQFQNQRELK